MFSPAERNIFGPYYDGHGHRWADPLFVSRTLTLELGGQPNEWFAKTRSPDPVEKGEAVGRIVSACLAAFSMAPFDPATGEGADEHLLLTTLDEYLKWRDSKKASTRATPTPLPSSGSGQDYPSNSGTAST